MKNLKTIFANKLFVGMFIFLIFLLLPSFSKAVEPAQDINNNGIPDLVFGRMVLGGSSYGTMPIMRIGFDVDENGKPQGGYKEYQFGAADPWSGGVWEIAQGEGGGVAVGNLDDNPRPEVVFAWDKNLGYDGGHGNIIRFRIGWNVNEEGNPENYSQFYYQNSYDGAHPLMFSDVSSYNMGGLEIKDVDGDGYNDLVALWAANQSQCVKPGWGSCREWSNDSPAYFLVAWNDDVNVGERGFSNFNNLAIGNYMRALDPHGIYEVWGSDTALLDINDDGIKEIIFFSKVPSPEGNYVYTAIDLFGENRQLSFIKEQEYNLLSENCNLINYLSYNSSGYLPMGVAYWGVSGAPVAGLVGRSLESGNQVLGIGMQWVHFEPAINWHQPVGFTINGFSPANLCNNQISKYSFGTYWGVVGFLVLRATGADLAGAKDYITENFSIWVVPPEITIAPGGSADYTVTVSSTKGDFSAPVSLTATDNKAGTEIKFYDLSGNEINSVTPPANDFVKCIMRVFTNSNASLSTHEIIVHGVSGSTGNDSNKVYLKFHSLSIIGDVYSGARIGNIYIAPGSVASANQTVTALGTQYKISNYNPVNIVKWELAKQKMTNTISRLKSEQAVIPTATNVSPWYLDTESNNPGVSPSAPQKYPDGKVWQVNGNLTLNNVTFYGKGTIIVNGRLTIRGNLQYGDSNSSLGIIANNIDINSSVNNLVGAYYTTGDINFRGGWSALAHFDGLFVGNQINLQRSAAIIQQDTKVRDNPPPGFKDLLAPIYQEQNP